MNIILFRNAAIVTTIFFKSENLLSSDLHEFWWIMRRVGSSRQPRAVAYGVWVCMITLYTNIEPSYKRKGYLSDLTIGHHLGEGLTFQVDLTWLKVLPFKLILHGWRSDLSNWPYMTESLTFQVDLTWPKVLPFKLNSHGWRSYLSSWPYMAEGLTFQVDLTWTKVLPFKLTSHGWRSYLSSWPYLAEGLTFLRPRWIAQAEASGAPAPSTTVPSWANPRQRQHKKI